MQKNKEKRKGNSEILRCEQANRGTDGQIDGRTEPNSYDTSASVGVQK